MPLRSTNAPKSVMFFTTPRRVWPGWISSSSFFFCSRRVSSIRSRRDSTMLRRSLLILMTLHSSVWPRKSSRLRAGTTSICEPGRNASTPPTSTSRPPLTLPLTVPLTTLPSSHEEVTLSQLRCCSARDLLSTTMPFSSSRRSSSTSTSSPTWISLKSLNSAAGSRPSDLYPMLTSTSCGRTSTTCPLTIAPSVKVLRVSSYIAIILARWASTSTAGFFVDFLAMTHERLMTPGFLFSRFAAESPLKRRRTGVPFRNCSGNLERRMKPRPETPHKPKNRENSRKSAKIGRFWAKTGIFGLFSAIFAVGSRYFCLGKRFLPFFGLFRTGRFPAI